MNLKKVIALMLAALLCVSLFAACGRSGEDADPDSTGESTQEDATANNPVRFFVGTYTESQTGAGTVEITLKGSDSAYIVVRWQNSPTESLTWNMSGKLNTRKSKIEYEDCFKTVTTYDSAGTGVSEIVYRDGKGVFNFEEDGLKWQDDEEYFADGLVFVRV